MDTSLKIYFNDGQEDMAFPYNMEQAELFSFTVNKSRMGGAPTISATLEYPVCLDDEWEAHCHFDDVFVTFNGERYYLKATPASSKSNDKLFYKHDLNFVSERAVLESVYMIDNLENQTEHIMPSNNTQVTFFGGIAEFVERINQSMYFSGIGDTCMYDTSTTPATLVPIADRVLNGDGYYILVDAGVTSDEMLVTLSDSTVSDALKQIFDTYGIPYYFVGKVIHVGNYEAVTDADYAVGGVLGAGVSSGALVPYEYGQPNAVLSVNRNNATKQLYNRCSGTGSSDNIPYYYPNPTPKGFLNVEADAGNVSILTGDLEIVDQLLFSQKMDIGSYCEYKGTYSSVYASGITFYAPFINYDTTQGEYGAQIIHTLSLPYRIEMSVQGSEDFNADARYYRFVTANFTGSGDTMYFSNELSIKDREQGGSYAYNVPLTYMTRAVVYKVGYYSGGTLITIPKQYVKALSPDDGYKFFAEDDVVYYIDMSYYIPQNVFEEASSVYGEFYIDMTAGFNANGLWALDGETDEKYFFKLSDIGVEVTIGVTPTVGDKFYQRVDNYIRPQEKLQPYCYRLSDGKERFYPALNYPLSTASSTPDTNIGDEVTGTTIDNDNYLDSNQDYLVFPNPYRRMRQKEHIEDFPDIKPTIKEMTNDDGRRIDMFAAVAFDTNDNNDGEYDENGNFIYNHPYFFAKLRKTDGTHSFNLFDCAIDESEMTIAMTSGHCAPCEFMIGVNEDQKNTVQVDSNGNLIRNEYGDVVCGRGEGSNPQNEQSPQARQNDTENYEVWIALKKDISTYGEIMPFYDGSTEIRPSACTTSSSDDGDTFVILHIEMPQAYITAAEQRLTEAVIAWMHENNSEKFNFSLKFSRVYLGENQSLISILNENVMVSVRYNGVTKNFYVSSYSYNMQSTSSIPEITISGLVETVDELKSVASSGGFAQKIGEQIADNFDNLMLGLNKPVTRVLNQNNTQVNNQIKGEFPTDYVRSKDELSTDQLVLGAGGLNVKKMPQGRDGQVLTLSGLLPVWGDIETDNHYIVSPLASDVVVPTTYSTSLGFSATVDEDGTYLILAQVALGLSISSSTSTPHNAIVAIDYNKTPLSAAFVEFHENSSAYLSAVATLSKEDVVYVGAMCDVANSMYLKATIGLSSTTFSAPSALCLIKIS